MNLSAGTSAIAIAFVYGLALSVLVWSVAERNVVRPVSPRNVSWARPVADSAGPRRVRLGRPGRLIVAAGLALGLAPILVADLPTWVVVFDGALLAVLCSLSIVDAWEYRIPDRIVLPALAGTGLLAAVSLVSPTLDAAAVAVGAAVFTALIGVPHLLRPDAMGLGDVKLAVLLGAAIGLHSADWLEALMAVGWAVAAASALGLASAALSFTQRRRTALVPFGPPLSFGTWLVVAAVA